MHARRLIPLVVLLLVAAVFLLTRRDVSPPATSLPPPAGSLPAHNADIPGPYPGEGLMATYGDPFSEPIEDLRTLDRVIGGYFSVVKEEEGFSIGGNEDLAAALRGENAYQQRFLPDDHRSFGPDGRLVDRWETPLFVHPVAAREIELRSAGPDREMFTADDLLLPRSPDGP